MSEKKKIAILGSGMASLGAAYELTSYKNWQDHYEITIYQMGWRLGGKTSTGRGPHERIQEVGIHIAQGWYNNAFRLIQDAYKECEENNLTPNSPFKNWEDAFEKENATLLTQYYPSKGKWISKNLVFPSNDLIPGQGGTPPLSEIIHTSIGLILELLIGSPYQEKSGCLGTLTKWMRKHFFSNEEDLRSISEKINDEENKFLNQQSDKQHPSWWKNTLAEIENDKSYPKAIRHIRFLHHARKIIKELPKQKGVMPKNQEPYLFEVIIKLLEEFKDWFDNTIGRFAEENEKIYWLRIFIEFGVVSIKGTLKDIYDPKTHKLDFDKINHLNFRDWLKQNGASQLLLDSAIVRFLYTGTFANQVGPQGQGAIAAGTAMNFLTQSVGYKGAFVYKFKAGTGDTMVGPVYEVLKYRGVNFKFFHKVEQVHYSDSGEIEKITVGEQVTLKNGTYNPTYEFKGLNVWPAAPLYDQIDDEQAKKLQEENIDLEMAWSPWKNISTKTLNKGEDFDQVILGIPINALQGKNGICREIIEKEEKWQQMVEHVKTTVTQSMQLWIKPTIKELGMNLPDWGIEKGGAPNLVTYASAMYSWIDMSLVIDMENWKDYKPCLLLYYSGSMTDPAVIPGFNDFNYPEEQLNRMTQTSLQWLADNMGYFFPNATTPEWPMGMNLDVLAGTEDQNKTDTERLKAQWLRANVNPTDRYTLSVPNSAKFRLKTDESGFSNMFLCGDWIDFGVNVGYFEGAITSGLQAAQALRNSFGLESDNEIFGEIEI